MPVQVEAYYFSSAAGHKRILGNRRFGENGFISSGRMQARPVAQSSHSGSKVKTCLLCRISNLGVFRVYVHMLENCLSSPEKMRAF